MIKVFVRPPGPPTPEGALPAGWVANSTSAGNQADRCTVSAFYDEYDKPCVVLEPYLGGRFYPSGPNDRSLSSSLYLRSVNIYGATLRDLIQELVDLGLVTHPVTDNHNPQPASDTGVHPNPLFNNANPR
jgi:hypothetical protein